MKRSRSSRAQRGSVLLLAIVMVVVLGLLAAAAISFSRSELSAARNMRSSDELLSCAEAGRQYLLSRFRLFNMNPKAIVVASSNDQLSGTCPPTAGSDERCVMGGHIGDTSGMTAVAVRPVAGSIRSSKNARDLSNVIADSTSLSGGDYQVTVHCADGRGREAEVEFVVRFGL